MLNIYEREEEFASPPHPSFRAKAPREPLEGIEKGNYKKRDILFSIYCLCSLLADREVSAHSGSSLDPQVGIPKRASFGPGVSRLEQRAW